MAKQVASTLCFIDCFALAPLGHIRIPGIGLERALILKIILISLSPRLVPVLYREFEYGLLAGCLIFVRDRLLRRLRLGMILVQIADSRYLGRYAKALPVYGDVATQIKTGAGEIRKRWDTYYGMFKEKQRENKLGYVVFPWKSEFT